MDSFFPKLDVRRLPPTEDTPQAGGGDIVSQLKQIRKQIRKSNDKDMTKVRDLLEKILDEIHAKST